MRCCQICSNVFFEQAWISELHHIMFLSYGGLFRSLLTRGWESVHDSGGVHFRRSFCIFCPMGVGEEGMSGIEQVIWLYWLLFKVLWSVDGVIGGESRLCNGLDCYYSWELWLLSIYFRYDYSCVLLIEEFYWTAYHCQNISHSYYLILLITLIPLWPLSTTFRCIFRDLTCFKN